MPHRTIKDVFGFTLDRDAEFNTVCTQLREAGVVIDDCLAQTNVACGLYDVHVSSDEEHSCLGCNLNECVHELAYFLMLDVQQDQALTHLHLALHLVNTMWERVSDVCKAVELPKKLWAEGEQNFPSFKTARAWTNFLKHPGFFGMGIHHPIYVVEGGAAASLATHAATVRSSSADPEWVLIDTAFVRKYWSRDHTGEKATKELEKPFTACVVLPNMVTLAQGVCVEFRGFVTRMKEPTWVETSRPICLTEMPCDWWED